MGELFENFNFVFNNHSGVLLDGVWEQYETECCTDLTILCEGGERLKLHRWLIQIFAPHILEQADSDNVVELSIEKDILKVIVQFFYKGKFEVCVNELVKLEKAAELLGVSYLVEAASEARIGLNLNADSTENNETSNAVDDEIVKTQEDNAEDILQRLPVITNPDSPVKTADSDNDAAESDIDVDNDYDNDVSMSDNLPSESKIGSEEGKFDELISTPDDLPEVVNETPESHENGNVSEQVSYVEVIESIENDGDSSADKSFIATRSILKTMLLKTTADEVGSFETDHAYINARSDEVGKSEEFLEVEKSEELVEVGKSEVLVEVEKSEELVEVEKSEELAEVSKPESKTEEKPTPLASKSPGRGIHITRRRNKSLQISSTCGEAIQIVKKAGGGIEVTSKDGGVVEITSNDGGSTFQIVNKGGKAVHIKGKNALKIISNAVVASNVGQAEDMVACTPEGLNATWKKIAYGGISVKCVLCEFKAETKMVFERHIAEFHSELKNKHRSRCPTCDFIAAHVEHLYEHWRQKHKQHLFSCNQCIFLSRTERLLVLHQRIEHGNYDQKKIACERCEFVAESEQLLVIHRQVVHKIRRRYLCKFCEFVSDTHEGLVKHQRNAHMVGEISAEAGSDGSNSVKIISHSGVSVRNNDVEDTIEESSVSDGEVETWRKVAYGGITVRCSKCQFSAGTKVEFDSHIATAHIDGALSRCNLCEFESGHLTILYNHWRLQHYQELLSCTQCIFLAKSEQLMSLHQHAEHGPDSIKKISCKSCAFIAETEDELESHREIIHLAAKQHSCPSCSYVALNRESLLAHRRQLHKGEGPMTCDMCSYVAKSEILLIRHRKFKHLNVRPYPCSLCKYAAKSRHSLKLHVQHRHEPKRFECEICGQKLSSQSELDKHLNNTLLHTRDQTQAACSLCSFVAERYDLLVKHRRTEHKRGVLAPCDMCPYVGKSTGALFRHRKYKHTTSRPFQCDKCKYAGKTASGLRLHMDRHKPKTLECEICGKKMSSQLAMDRHRKNIHDNQFLCPICDSPFHSKVLLKRHLEKNHDPKLIAAKMIKSSMVVAKRVVHEKKISESVPEVEVAIESVQEVEAAIETVQEVEAAIETVQEVEAAIENVPQDVDPSDENLPQEQIETLEIGSSSTPKKRRRKVAEQVSCSECGKVLSGKSQLKRHIDNVHNPKEAVFTCNFCVFTTKTKDYLAQHLKRMHQNVG